MRRLLSDDLLKARLAALVFGYEAVVLAFSPTIKRFGVNAPPLTDIAIKHPFGTGVLAGILAFHLHVHYQQKVRQCA